MKTESVSLEQVTTFERLQPQLEALCEELKELSKKKADAAISKFKVKLINEKLELANSLLGGEFKPFKDFDVLDIDAVPTTSDAVIVLSQYLESLETWRSSRISYERETIGGNWYWCITDERVSVKTHAPKRAQVEEVESDEDEEE